MTFPFSSRCIPPGLLCLQCQGAPHSIGTPPSPPRQDRPTWPPLQLLLGRRKLSVLNFRILSQNLLRRSGSGAKEMILMWVQNRLKDYPIPMTNFSTCWNDGLAFCALIHVFYPDNFDWYALKAENRRHNFTLGFDKAE